MRTRRIAVAVLAVVVLALGSSVWAEPKTDTYWGTWQGHNEFLAGGGSGWGPGAWIEYTGTPFPLPIFWNQWFYDDPPDPLRWKWIDYSIDTMAATPDPNAWLVYGSVTVALNWSNLGFPTSGPDGPPPMPSQEEFIERYVVATIPLDLYHLVDYRSGHYEIPDFNPEWVSIDVNVDMWQVVRVGETNENWPLPVTVSGSIIHECAPEPATLSLLALGGLALIRRRK